MTDLTSRTDLSDRAGPADHSGHTDHLGPVGLRTRATVVVVPGRGETRATYARLGARLAADAYRVRVVDAPDLDPDDLHGALDRFAARLAAAVDGTAAADGTVRPLVLLGADTGAAAVAALLAPGAYPAAPAPDAVVLAGLPGRTATATGPWEDELDVRTACPVHRSTLTDDDRVRRGSLGDPVPDALFDAAYGGASAVPALFLVGDADPLADLDALLRTATSLPRARLSVVRGAHHDVLNDTQHRAVAAEIVAFLEALRDALVPAVAVRISAW
ncbi:MULTISPECIES: alpha/beta hydrolase [Streptomyces]|uniref:alpha/beta hydrolase n=2 Tax=Streptomyces TaxID=1883 RepID=UPI0004B51609|nr:MULTISPECIES: alpha/beta hydrolase [Streptomyces]SCE26091.1 Lysophospholipase, alpha-beta hydrolase superfamily [Streptomyces sp. DpondAA-D4]